MDSPTGVLDQPQDLMLDQGVRGVRFSRGVNIRQRTNQEEALDDRTACSSVSRPATMTDDRYCNLTVLGNEVLDGDNSVPKEWC